MQKIVIRHLSGARANQVDEFSMAAVKELIIGREASASIRFDADRDDLVSRQHAKVQLDSADAESLQLVDLQSRNGTFLNRQRVYGAIRINHNDVVQLGAGGPEFRLEMDPPPSGAARPTRQASLDTLGRLGSKATREAWPSAIAGAPAISGVPVAGPRPVGRGTVERMLGEAFGHVKRETNRLTWVGIAALLAIVAVGGGIRYYLRESATAQAAAQEQNIQTLQRMNEELKKNPAAAESMKQQIAKLESEVKRSNQRNASTDILLKEVNSRMEHGEALKTTSDQSSTSTTAAVSSPATGLPNSSSSAGVSGQSYDALMDQATEQFQHGQPKKALALTQLAIETDKTRWEGYEFAGQIAAMLDDKDTAINMYRKALSLAPADNRQDIQYKLDDVQKKMAKQ